MRDKDFAVMIWMNNCEEVGKHVSPYLSCNVSFFLGVVANSVHPSLKRNSLNLFSYIKATLTMSMCTIF